MISFTERHPDVGRRVRIQASDGITTEVVWSAEGTPLPNWRWTYVDEPVPANTPRYGEPQAARDRYEWHALGEGILPESTDYVVVEKRSMKGEWEKYAQGPYRHVMRSSVPESPVLDRWRWRFADERPFPNMTGSGTDDLKSISQWAQTERNPKDVIGETKLQLELLPYPAMAALTRVLSLGARKYGRFNWRDHSIESNQYVSATLRHLWAWNDGEDFDPESGESHLAHAMACLAIMLDADSTGSLKDIRPKRTRPAE